MASGTPSDDNPPAARGTEPSPAANSPRQTVTAATSTNPVSLAFDDPQWREANRVLERRYLDLGRAQIDEMCLDLKARLAARVSAGLQERLTAEGPFPDISSVAAGRQIEAATAAATKLLADISWVLPWEQARSLVEPYAKGSWLLAQIQSVEEQRVIGIFAAELLEQATAYMRELIFRFYGADEAIPADPPPPSLPTATDEPRD